MSDNCIPVLYDHVSEYAETLSVHERALNIMTMSRSIDHFFLVVSTYIWILSKKGEYFAVSGSSLMVAYVDVCGYSEKSKGFIK